MLIPYQPLTLFAEQILKALAVPEWKSGREPSNEGAQGCEGG